VNKTINPEFARIADLAVDAYGWFECDREAFLANANNVHYRIVTLAKRSMSGKYDLRMLACTQQILTQDIEMVLQRIAQAYNLWGERDGFVCLFHTHQKDTPYVIGDETSLTYTAYDDKMLQIIQ
jgi:hypothetical protein